MRIIEECYGLFSTNPGSNNPRNNSCTATYLPSRHRYAGHYRRSKDELISDIFLWTPSHERASVGPLARTYLHQFCVNAKCNLEEQPGAVDDRDG